MEAPLQGRHRREVDDVGEAAVDHEVGLSGVTSSTTTLRGLNVIRRGEKFSAKRKTTRPRISAARFGSRAMPRSIGPKDAGRDPVLNHAPQANAWSPPVRILAGFEPLPDPRRG